MRNDFILIALLAGFALFLPLTLFGCVSQMPPVTPSPQPSVAPSIQTFGAASVSPSPVAKFLVVVTINNGTANYSKTLEVAAGTTVLSLMQANFEIAAKQYSFGALVTGIDGLEQNDSTWLYWQYYVDGVLAPVGAGEYKIEKNVSIEWRYEKPAFS
ncbi:MAG: DUF4430 domain-containing protein [Candidatus Norongarragalinales archaeon]